MRSIAILGILVLFCIHVSAQKPAIGIVQELENDSVIHAAGYQFLSESIIKCFSPKTVSDDQFKKNLAVFKRLKTPLVACNLFIPTQMKLVGPDLHEPELLAYAESVFERSQRAGMKMIIWGSGGARRIPDGFDHKKARQQFVTVATALAALAKEYDVILVLEPLNRSETNFINTLEEAHAIAKDIDHPNLRINADLYHMLKENEPPSSIARAAKYIVHCEIAEKDGRSPPGTHGEDFRLYLEALKKIHFTGKIMLECRWDDLKAQAGPARLYLQKQVDDVWGH